MMNKYFYQRVLLISLLGFSQLVYAQRDNSFLPDAFGYETAACSLFNIDISDSGQALNFLDVDGNSTSDDGVASLVLPTGFEFYQQLFNGLLVSTNGYVTLANSNNADNGADFSNDCPLPAVPDNGAAELSRIFVLHDDLELTSAGANVFAEFIQPCPRAGLLAGEGCQVIQWQNISYRNQAGAVDISLQLLLYPSSRQIVMQYPGVDHETVSASIGLQAAGGVTAFNLGCNSPQLIPASGAICLVHPLSAEVLLIGGFESFTPGGDISSGLR